MTPFLLILLTLAYLAIGYCLWHALDEKQDPFMLLPFLALWPIIMGYLLFTGPLFYAREKIDKLEYRIVELEDELDNARRYVKAQRAALLEMDAIEAKLKADIVRLSDLWKNMPSTELQ